MKCAEPREELSGPLHQQTSGARPDCAHSNEESEEQKCERKMIRKNKTMEKERRAQEIKENEQKEEKRKWDSGNSRET